MNKTFVTCICGKCDLNSQEHQATAFLMNSNLIENEHSVEALEDAHEAWNYALTVKEMRLRHLLKIHELLMKRLNPRIVGKIRKCDVFVGNRICMKPAKLKRELASYFNDFNKQIDTKNIAATQIISRAFHVEFEKIHPFEDGNGRTGRIIYNWQRLKYGLPIHVIKVGKEQQEYYKWFK